MAGTNSPKLAVLIDADNTTPAIVADLLAEIAKYGTATVKRAYGDWTTPRLSGWKDANNSHAIQPMQQFSYTTGKNATDSALIIDAMDLLYTGNLDGFCLVSSDSDFTKLASRLRESGMTVYGFGEPKTPKPLVAACDKFVYLDVLRTKEKAQQPEADSSSSPAAPKRRSPNELHKDRKLVQLLRDGIDANSDDDGWAALGGVGSHVAKQAPDFDSRNWGYSKLVDLISEIGLFEVQRVAGQQVRVRERQADRSDKQDRSEKHEPQAERASEKPATRSSRSSRRGHAEDAPAAPASESTSAPEQAPEQAPSTPASTPVVAPAEVSAPEADSAPTTPARKTRTRKSASRQAGAPSAETAPVTAPEATPEAPAQAEAPEATAPPAKKTTRKRAASSRTTKKAAAKPDVSAEPSTAPAAPAAAEAGEQAPAKQVARKKTVTRNAVKTVQASTPAE
ncbi:NYN domain-containing protein [Nocardioides houyundeii]|uniref:NYN domain-containing protein n=1 Tax=Nocardioides houyundeii TaxID=2045452 RepID=UPI000C7901E5|nr:NYN domain-containing protein [Nocardioides houyundeii]